MVSFSGRWRRWLSAGLAGRLHSLPGWAAGGRITEARHLAALVRLGALVLAWMSIHFRARAVEVPDADARMDMEAYRAPLPTPLTNRAAIALDLPIATFDSRDNKKDT